MCCWLRRWRSVFGGVGGVRVMCWVRMLVFLVRVVCLRAAVVGVVLWVGGRFFLYR